MADLKWVDIPPVWLLAFILAAWGIGRADPLELSFGGPWAQLPAGLLIGGGIVLMVLAVIEMRKWRTTVVPHRDAGHLVTSGIFKRSRNPIYLGDALILAGMIFRLDAPLALPLVPIFFWVIERRFILAEEDRLRRKFRLDFARYAEATRRWVYGAMSPQNCSAIDCTPCERLLRAIMSERYMFCHSSATGGTAREDRRTERDIRRRGARCHDAGIGP